MRRVALTTFIVLWGSGASAYPIARPKAEIPIRWDNPVAAVGGWSVDGHQLRRASESTTRGYYLTDAPAGGFARVRIRRASDFDGAVLFRTRVVERRPFTFEGYGFGIDARRGRTYFVRYDRGGTRYSGASVDADILKGRNDLEACLWLVGTTFVGVVFDGITKEQLATLSWSDPAYPTGGTGMYLYKRGADDSTIEMSVSVANVPAQPVEHPDLPGQPWISADWTVIIPTEDLPALPDGVPFRRVRDPDLPENHAALITDEVGATILAEHGILPIEVRPGVPYKYRDGSYFRRVRKGIRPGKGLSEYPEGFKDPVLIDAMLDAIHATWPRLTRIEDLGLTAEGRIIRALHIGTRVSDETRPAFLLVAAHHGNEISTPDFPLDAAWWILSNQQDPRVARWLDNLRIVVVPVVNIDGSHAYWHLSDNFGRKNRRVVVDDGIDAAESNRGTDLNRNYPLGWNTKQTKLNSNYPTSSFYRGDAPASEPEVQAMMALADRMRFAGSITYHAAATRILVPYTIDGFEDPDPSAAWTIAEAMVEQLPHKFGRKSYQAVRSLYAVNGTEKDWYHHEFGTMAYLIEVPYLRPRLSQQADAIEHSRAAWQVLFDRWLDGPSVDLRVRTPDGRPVEASVRFEEITLKSGEHWTTHPKTGRFHHFLPAPGRYTAVVETEDASERVRFRVEEGVKRVRVVLDETVENNAAAE